MLASGQAQLPTWGNFCDSLRAQCLWKSWPPGLRGVYFFFLVGKQVKPCPTLFPGTHFYFLFYPGRAVGCRYHICIESGLGRRTSKTNLTGTQPTILLKAYNKNSMHPIKQMLRTRIQPGGVRSGCTYLYVRSRFINYPMASSVGGSLKEGCI